MKNRADEQPNTLETNRDPRRKLQSLACKTTGCNGQTMEGTRKGPGKRQMVRFTTQQSQPTRKKRGYSSNSSYSEKRRKEHAIASERANVERRGTHCRKGDYKTNRTVSWTCHTDENWQRYVTRKAGEKRKCQKIENAITRQPRKRSIRYLDDGELTVRRTDPQSFSKNG